MPLVLNSSSITGASSITGLTSGGLYAPGHVMQVQQASYTTEVSSSSNSYATTGLSASITPLSTSSKILVMFSIGGILTSSSTFGLGFAIYKNGSAVWTDTHTYDEGYYGSIASAYRPSRANFQYLDSPASTSSLTYTVYFAAYTGTMTIQQVGADSRITLMEIAA